MLPEKAIIISIDESTGQIYHRVIGNMNQAEILGMGLYLRDIEGRILAMAQKRTLDTLGVLAQSMERMNNYMMDTEEGGKEKGCKCTKESSSESSPPEESGSSGDEPQKS